MGVPAPSCRPFISSLFTNVVEDEFSEVHCSKVDGEISLSTNRGGAARGFGYNCTHGRLLCGEES
jgi:hypothetical protein